MKSTLSFLSLAAAAIGVGSGAAAAQEVTVSPVYGYVDLEDTAYHAVGGRLEARFVGPFGAEVDALFGVGEDTRAVTETNVDFEISSRLESRLGGFVTASFALSPQTRVGVKAGALRLEIEADALGVTASDAQSGAALGLFYRHQLGADGRYVLRFDVTGAQLDRVDVREATVALGWRF